MRRLLRVGSASIADIRDTDNYQRMSRTEFQRTASPHLVADVTMYLTKDGGRRLYLSCVFPVTGASKT
jgi:hypothetical protein